MQRGRFNTRGLDDQQRKLVRVVHPFADGSLWCLGDF
jgi:hypothetical protein